MPIVSDDTLYARLLKALVDRLREKHPVEGKAAHAIMRAGRVMYLLGAWLVRREAMNEAEYAKQRSTVEASTTADADALIELVLKDEMGAPFPPVDA